ncbi:MAG: hypothetical protein MZV49_09300 [Rhodopseudomonas palustris]|nr:hypothetical protein [Rhodopseudomonas palustris]
MVLERMVLSNKSFDTALRLVLEQAGADFSEIDGIIYIFEIQKRDILKKLRDSTTLEIKYLPVTDLVSAASAGTRQHERFQNR